MFYVQYCNSVDGRELYTILHFLAACVKQIINNLYNMCLMYC